MWLTLAFLSAALLGLYDVCKKRSLAGNAVLPVLWLNTLLCASIFLPLILLSALGVLGAADSLYIPRGGTYGHLLVAAKSVIVLSSWICGYFAIKHLPLTIVGPINASRPVLVLLGALLVYGERLNAWQWAGVVLTILSLFLLSRSSKREGIRFTDNRWIALLACAAVLGAVSGLFDKFLMAPAAQGGAGLDKLFVQGWYNQYQAILMGLVFLLISWQQRRQREQAMLKGENPAARTQFQWRWSIVLISLFLTAADLAYFYALSQPEALIAVVSMVRRGSVLVSFAFGAFVLRESHLRAKAIDLLLVLLGMLCLYMGG